MEMTLAYLRETVDVIAGNGFTSNETVETVTNGAGAPLYDRHAFELRRSANEDLVLECLIYPDGTETYWLELRRMHRLKTFPFQIDSWKHHADRIEFRYYARDDGVALTIEMAFADPT